jgi:hypothetical protein
MATTLADASAPAAAAAAPPHKPSYRFLLLFRFGIVNLTGFALLGAVWMQGWLDPLFEADSLTHMCKLIFVLFLVGLARAGREVGRLSFELNQLEAWSPLPGSSVATYLADTGRQDSAARATLAETMRLRLAQKIAPVRHAASRLVMLGIIGTILGFIIALYGGVNPESASDVQAVGPMVALVLRGIGMAFFKTLTGSVLNLWLMINYRLLEEGTVHLVTHLTEIGERRHADA